MVGQERDAWHGSTMASNPNIPPKSEMGDISKRLADHSKPPKNIQEKIKKKALVDTVFTVSKS